MSPTRENMMLTHSLPLSKPRHRARLNPILALCAMATFAYVLFWLSQHRFMEQAHHYITALVIVGWLAVLPLVAFYTHERSKHHGLG